IVARSSSSPRGLKPIVLQLALDDFGPGYSALSYLQRFPIDAVKIDRSFVSRRGPRAEGHEIVKAIVTLAHNLKMRVIAEGVETQDQLAVLRMLKCGFGQGWLFSKPISLPAGEGGAGERSALVPGPLYLLLREDRDVLPGEPAVRLQVGEADDGHLL